MWLSGAGSGNRTPVASLEDWSSAIELCPQVTRTRDLELGKLALCQLSYVRVGGVSWGAPPEIRTRNPSGKSRELWPVELEAQVLVARWGVASGAPGEIRTPNLRIRNPLLCPLSYERRGVDETAHCCHSWRALAGVAGCLAVQSGQRAPTPRPPPWQGGALPTELCPRDMLLSCWCRRAVAVVLVLCVREERLELSRPCGHQVLNLARLPFRHSRVGTERIGFVCVDDVRGADGETRTPIGFRSWFTATLLHPIWIRLQVVPALVRVRLARGPGFEPGIRGPGPRVLPATPSPIKLARRRSVVPGEI